MLEIQIICIEDTKGKHLNTYDSNKKKKNNRRLQTTLEMKTITRGTYYRTEKNT